MRFPSLATARAYFRRIFAHFKNEQKMDRQTHLRQKRRLPKAPNRNAHNLAIWRENRGIL